MFGLRNDNNVDPTLEQVGTIIGPGAILDGPLTTMDSTRIDGTVKGNVTISGALIVGQEGKILGNVSAVNAYVAGEITGNVYVPQGKIEISDTGKVVGDVTCKGIIIDENAVFSGQCDMAVLVAGATKHTVGKRIAVSLNLIASVNEGVRLLSCIYGVQHYA